MLKQKQRDMKKLEFTVEFQNGTYENVRAVCALDGLFKAMLKKEGTSAKLRPVRVWDENENSLDVNYSLISKLLR